MSGETPAGDDVLRSAKIAAVLGAAFTAGAFVIADERAAGSVAIGAAFGVGNLIAMRAILGALVPSAGEGPPERETDDAPKGSDLRMLWAFLAGFKMLAMFGAMWLLLTKGVVDPMPLVVGYGAMPLGIVGSALLPGPRPPA